MINNKNWNKTQMNRIYNDIHEYNSEKRNI